MFTSIILNIDSSSACSYRTGDFTDLTFDASYVLTLIHKASQSMH